MTERSILIILIYDLYHYTPPPRIQGIVPFMWLICYNGNCLTINRWKKGGGFESSNIFSSFLGDMGTASNKSL